MKRTLLSLILILVLCGDLLGQEADSSHQMIYPGGLSLRGGPGWYAVRDEFISHEKYTGYLPVFFLTWTDVTPRRLNRILLEYRSASRIKNYNVSTTITEFAFGVDYLYPLGHFPLMSRNVYVWLGPSPELFLHFRSQNIASGGSALTRAYSAVLLISAGASAEFACPVSEDLQAAASLGTNLLSFGGRFVNPENSDEQFFKPLTIFSGMRLVAEIGVRYEVFPDLTLGIGYRLEVVRVSAWSYFISGSDMAVLSAQYAF